MFGVWVVTSAAASPRVHGVSRKREIAIVLHFTGSVHDRVMAAMKEARMRAYPVVQGALEVVTVGTAVLDLVLSGLTSPITPGVEVFADNLGYSPAASRRRGERGEL